MKKRKKGRKLSRKRDPRKALLKSLTETLFLNEKIKTTEAKAKELSRLAEKFVTKAKKINLGSRKLLLKELSPEVVKKLEKEIEPRYKERKGGYTRIIKIGSRKSDGAKMVIIELIK